MEVERIFSAEQIQVHPDLSKIIREYTKAVIRENPEDLIEFSWKYFRQKVELEEERKLMVERELYEQEMENESTPEEKEGK
mmetsp:Transcript_20056/g.19351  ORF Transcript_20056/g.19351 Transcript_20056/m.19351 type:complete len:81 (+) Transcript_20056:213-455(+)|eukprot:CAMPEP_0119040720 /NCGR_PEP_ID=MMETSP1177-20130426/10729_1 /TAXON_ID=2985 /ORGANISM="Ochromonas sp, Strain CCMP1899" /LENGTH=80 /DNA_ID=CAMNT_0007006033 /DNA_START=190 /DNA_END=432 /DNA_ORIENTATION=-